jgi:hypothetical protein
LGVVPLALGDDPGAASSGRLSTDAAPELFMPSRLGLARSLTYHMVAFTQGKESPVGCGHGECRHPECLTRLIRGV